MVKGHERKSYQPSSSGKAAQLLANSGPKAGGFGFGGFSGATPIAGTNTPAAASTLDADALGNAAAVPALTGELDSEITQLLRSLSKRDATTKSKALQKLKSVIASKDASTVATCLPAWAYVYNKLVMDNNRTVRSEASGVLGAMAKTVGKGLAPFLKALAGSWWLAQFDLHSEAAAAARDAFQAAFAGPKQKEALLFTRTEVLLFLQDNLKATPEALGDARKETPEELAERHERVVAASLLAVSSLLDLLVSKEEHQNPTERDAQSEVVVQLESLLGTQGFLKRVLSSKSPHVRTAAYTLTAHICYRAPQLLEKHMQAAAPLVLGVFQEQHASAHPNMWEMVLAFVKAYPSAWHAVDTRKAVLPRLLAFLRSGCYGSATSSYPATLPLLHLLPKGLLGPDPKVVNDILEAMWSGCVSNSTSGRGREAAASAFTECLSWLLTQASKVAGAGQGTAEGFTRAVLQGTFRSQVVPAALQGSAAISSTAQQTTVDVVRQAHSMQGGLSWLPPVVASQLGSAISSILTSSLTLASSAPLSASAAASTFNRAEALLDALQPAVDQQLLATAVAGPMAAALVGPVQQGSALPEAASLLARLVKHFSAEILTAAPAVALPGAGRTTGAQEAQLLSMETMIGSALAGPQQGPAAQANADLLLSCLQGKPYPAQELANTLHYILGLPIPDASDAASDTRTSGRSPITSSVSGGTALAVLLIQRLLQTTVQQGSHVLDWQTPNLDALACQLATFDDATTPPASPATDEHVSEAESLPEKTNKAADDSTAADTASLAASVAAAPLDPPEQTAAAQETPLSHISNGLSHMHLQRGTSSTDDSAQLLGLLISGKGHVSLLTDWAVQHVMTKLVKRLESAESHPGQDLLTVLHALDLCLYSEAVTAMTVLHQLQNQLLALVYKLSWGVKRSIHLADSYLGLTRHPHDDFSSESSSDGALEADVVAANGTTTENQSLDQQVAQAASRVWAQGKRPHAMMTKASDQERSGLESELQAVLSSRVTRACTDEPEELDWELQLASLIQEAYEAVTPNGSTDSPSVILRAVLDPLAERHEQQAARTLLASGLCQVMGFQPVVLRDTPRASVCVALLFAAQTDAAFQETAQHLLSFLTSGPTPNDSECSPGSSDRPSQVSTLLSDTLTALITAARSSTSLPDTTGEDIFQTSRAAACVPALVQLLEKVAAARTSTCLPVLSQWFCSNIVNASEPYPSSVLSELLPVVVPALRRSETLLLDSQVSELTQQQLRHSAELPPVAAALSRSSDPNKLADVLQTLDTICNCFPCPSTPLATPSGGHTPTAVRLGSAAATAAERQALMAAALRQLQGERSAALAAAAARRAAEGQEAESSSAAATSASEGADASVARLILCAVTYCWKDISAHDWSAMLKRVSESVSQAAVLIEDLTEDVAAAAVEGASMVSRGRQGGDVGPQVAIELLWRLHHMGLSDKAEGAQVAQQQMTQLLSSQESLSKLGGAPEASLQTLAAMLALNAGQAPSALQKAAPQDTWQSGTRDALRILLACGAIEAITCATSQSAADSCAMWQASSQAMWDAVSAIAVSAASEGSLEAVTASVQEADAWGQDMGVDATGALMALLLSPNPQQRLQQAALALLLTKPLLPSVTAASTRADEESPEVPPAKTDSVTALIRAGVRPQLAAAICEPPADPLLDPSDPQEAQMLQPFLLAWAVLLAHILVMPAGDSGKAFLAQALRGEYEVVPNLLRAILPLLPLEKVGAGKKDKASSNSSDSKQQPPRQWNIAQALQQIGVCDSAAGIAKLAEAVYRGVLHALPASARAWFGDLRDRGLSAAVEAFTAEQESPLLLQHEFHLVQTAPAPPDMDNFSLKANNITREVVAVMEIEDGAVLEMVIKLPSSSPLRRAEVACRRRVGVTEGKLRKWLLSVTAFLANQNGSVAEAIALWRRNVQKEFEGVEECLICYSIVSASDGKLPRMHCKTCSKRFHGTCLYKWFQSSGKSNCPHCQSPW